MDGGTEETFKVVDAVFFFYIGPLVLMRRTLHSENIADR